MKPKINFIKENQKKKPQKPRMKEIQMMNINHVWNGNYYFLRLPTRSQFRNMGQLGISKTFILFLMCYTHTFCVSDHVKPRNIFPSDVGPQQIATKSFWLFSVFVGSIIMSFNYICHLATHKVSIQFMNSPKQDKP